MGQISEKLLDALKRENELLKDQIQDFEKLYEVLSVIGSSLAVDEVIHHITVEALKICQADQGAVLVFDPSGQSEARTLIRQGESEAIKLDHFLNMMLAGWVSKENKPLLRHDLTEFVGESFARSKYAEIASALSVPLNLRGNLLGVLNLVRLKGKPGFSEKEQRLLTLLATIFSQFIHNAKLHYEVFTENQRLKEEIRGKYEFQGIIGQSTALKSIFSLLEKVIPTDARVLIEGESGTGKELIAKVIHYNGSRKDAPFIAVDCGALPANLLEGELFGYLKGAFTGAIRDKKGLFAAAHGGTLFLDEIANMPLEIQSKFLRAIQEGEVRPLGSDQVKKVDVRIIAAGSGDLRQKVENGGFREDLFYRLNVVSIKLPPLRNRKGDIPILANFFLEKMAKRYNRQVKGFKADTMAHLEAYNWPGNIREMENFVERMAILAEDQHDYIPVELLPFEIRPHDLGNIAAQQADLASGNIKSKKANYEKIMLIEALTNNDWNQSAAARELGISERTVRYKMQKFDLQKP